MTIICAITSPRMMCRFHPMCCTRRDWPWRAWSVIREAAATLTDVTPLDVEQLRLTACGVPGIEYCHAVRARGEPGQVRIDLHIHVDPALSVREAHAIARTVEETLRAEVGGIAEVLVRIGAGSR